MNIIELAAKSVRDAEGVLLGGIFMPWENATPENQENWRKVVRDTLKAIREPSEVMILGGVLNSGDDEDSIRERWQAMIDAALAEQTVEQHSEVERAREYVASSMHDRDHSWGDLVRAGERDDCPEMRMVLKAMRAERQIEANVRGTWPGD